MTRFPSFLLPLWRGTRGIIFAEHGMHYFPNFQQKKKTKAEFHPYQMCHLNI